MADSSADHIEVEWQFAALDTRPIARWLESGNARGFIVTPGPVKELRDTYLDTAGWRVHQAGYTCRVREKGDGAELTLKAMSEPRDGMRSRREVNSPIPTPTIAAALAAPGTAGDILRAAAGRVPPRELFRIHTSRHIYLLADGAGPVGEIALDNTSIPIGAEDVPARFARVEVEVDQDAVRRVQKFIDQMVAEGGLQPATTSKFEAALLATGQRPPGPLDAGPTAVTAEMTAAEVAYAVLRKQLGVLAANEAGTRVGEDIEALHDMRVACRRLRAALGAFAPVLHPSLQRFRDECGWLGGALGPVRDLDVQLEQLAQWQSGLGGQSAHALDALEAVLRARRVRARKVMLRALDLRRYQLLVERFAATLRRGPPRNFAPGRQPVLAIAPDLVEKRYRQVRKRGDAIGHASPAADYHALRIDAKKLRYALEFVGPIYGKSAVAFSQRATAMQDILGRHQDADVAIAMLAGLAVTERRLAPVTLMAMGGISERYAREAEALRRQFPRVYRPFKGKEWRALHRLLESRRPPPGVAPEPPRGRSPAPLP